MRDEHVERAERFIRRPCSRASWSVGECSDITRIEKWCVRCAHVSHLAAEFRRDADLKRSWIETCKALQDSNTAPLVEEIKRLRERDEQWAHDAVIRTALRRKKDERRRHRAESRLSRAVGLLREQQDLGSDTIITTDGDRILHEQRQSLDQSIADFLEECSND